MEINSLTDAEITATGIALIQRGFGTVAIEKTRRTDDLMDALRNNRSRLQTLKAEYVKAVQTDGGVEKTPSSRRRMIFHEIMRIHGAMEGLKNELTQRGANFDIDVNDVEHPNAAFKRLTSPAPKPETSNVMFLYLVLSGIVFFLWFFTSFLGPNDWRQFGPSGPDRASSLSPGR